MLQMASTILLGDATPIGALVEMSLENITSREDGVTQTAFVRTIFAFLMAVVMASKML